MAPAMSATGWFSRLQRQRDNFPNRCPTRPSQGGRRAIMPPIERRIFHKLSASVPATDVDAPTGQHPSPFAESWLEREDGIAPPPMGTRVSGLRTDRLFPVQWGALQHVCPLSTAHAVARKGLDFPSHDKIRNLLHVGVREPDAAALLRGVDPDIHSRVRADIDI